MAQFPCSQYITRQQVRLAYRTWSHAPHPTLFIHGNVASSRWWQPTVESLANRHPEADRLLIAPDWRGCGLSDIANGPLSLEILADDQIALLDHLGIERAHLVGHSTGGLIGLIAMARAPERFGKAVLLDPVYHKGLHIDEETRNRFDLMAQDTSLMETVIGSTILGNDSQNPFFQSVIVNDAVSAMRKLGQRVLNMLSEVDYTATIKKLHHRILVLHGEYDEVLPKDHSQQLANVLINGEFYELKGHGHCANIENASKFAQCLDEYLFEIE
jgi:pimeloyl-ACP methyl ester carboxylesterase